MFKLIIYILVGTSLVQCQNLHFRVVKGNSNVQLDNIVRVPHRRLEGLHHTKFLAFLKGKEELTIFRDR